MKKVRIVWIATVFLLGCSGGDPKPEVSEGDLDRQVMLTHWADNIIIPSYNTFKILLDDMIQKSEAFADAPDEDALIAFRHAWEAAYIGWQKVELFETGPADRYTIRNFFNIYPTSVAGILANINSGSANMKTPASYANQGFPALDYLLNGVADTDEGIVAYYSTEPDAEKRLAYIKRITDRMDELLTKVITEWPTYRATFISKTGLDIGSPMGLTVNAYVLNYERYIRSGKFGIPSGAMTISGETKYPDKVEAFYKRDISKVLATVAHQASIDFFNGKDVVTGLEGPSLKSYLDGLDAKDTSTNTLLSTIINEQFNAANAKLDLLPDNLHDAVESDNESMLAVFAEMQKEVRLLKVDMTSAMSITITY
ncbi:MAG TPA: imelysin family protein, partial [Chryseolinea sp.]|nr:imelysin family protein [Chryseolinea sp.]